MTTFSRAPWVPGLLLAMALATAALRLGDLPFLRETLHLGALLLVILLGMALASLLVLPDFLAPGIRMAQRPILRWAVAGLGFRLSLGEVLAIGGPGLMVVAVSTIGSLAFSLWIARRLGLSWKLGILLGVGTAICGASAIVAADSVVQAERRDTAVALGVITLYGTIGILLYPWVGRHLGLDDQVFGIWDGASLHETAQVVAAGFSMSEEAARVATVVKLARICLLAPIVFWLAWWLRRHQEDTGAAQVSAVPWFLVVFIVFAGVNSAGLIPPDTLTLLRRADLWLLCVGMAGVGLHTGLGDLRAAGIKPLAAGLLGWLALAGLALGLATLAAGR